MWPFKKKSINPIINLNKSGLTDTQVRTLQEAKCPDCNGDLYEGPCGGMMMNVHCDKGQRKFPILKLEKK